MRFVVCFFIVVVVVAHSGVLASPIYCGGYDELRVGQVRFNDTMTFPAGLSTQVRRRYILTGVERGARYLIHLSYMGSPSIKYSMHVRRLHRSLLEHIPVVGPQPFPGQRQLADVVMLHVMTASDGQRFDYIDGDGDVDNGVDAMDEVDGDYVPLLEVHGVRDAFPVQPDKWRVFFYTLRLEAIGGDRWVNRLLVWHSVMVAISVVAVVLLVPRLIAAIAGDAPRPQQPRYDLLICLINRNGAAGKKES